MKSGVVARKAVLRLLQPLNVDAAVAAVASTIKKKTAVCSCALRY